MSRALRSRIARLQDRGGVLSCPCGATTVWATVALVLSEESGDAHCPRCSGPAPPIPLALVRRALAEARE